MINQLPHLTQFFSSYFHQDWLLEAESASEVVKNYCNTAPPASIEAVSAELKQLLEMPIAEPDLETFVLEELGCYYDPSSDDLTVREWLESVQKSLNRSS
jgi:CdiI immunity protein